MKKLIRITTLCVLLTCAFSVSAQEKEPTKQKVVTPVTVKKAQPIQAKADTTTAKVNRANKQVKPIKIQLKKAKAEKYTPAKKEATVVNSESKENHKTKL